MHFFRALPLPGCYTTEQSAVDASLFAKFSLFYRPVLEKCSNLTRKIQIIYSYLLCRSGMVAHFDAQACLFHAISRNKFFIILSCFGFLLMRSSYKVHPVMYKKNPFSEDLR